MLIFSDSKFEHNPKYTLTATCALAAWEAAGLDG